MILYILQFFASANQKIGHFVFRIMHTNHFMLLENYERKLDWMHSSWKARSIQICVFLEEVFFHFFFPPKSPIFVEMFFFFAKNANRVDFKKKKKSPNLNFRP
jgi:hypothetical protein